MPAPREFERYLGIPFCADGYGYDGCHCWGLVRLVLLECTGVKLAEFDAVATDDLRAVARAMATGAEETQWRSVARDNLRKFDVVLMAHSVVHIEQRPVRAAMHCGVMLTPDDVLHVEVGRNAICVSLTHSSVRHRLLGFYRHAALA